MEFYVLDTATDEAYLASYVVDKLDKSSVFKKLNSEFSIMGIETKGDTHNVLNIPYPITCLQCVKPTALTMAVVITTARHASAILAGWPTHSAVYMARRD